MGWPEKGVFVLLFCQLGVCCEDLAGSRSPFSFPAPLGTWPSTSDRGGMFPRGGGGRRRGVLWSPRPGLRFPASHSAGQLWAAPPPPPACDCESHLREGSRGWGGRGGHHTALFCSGSATDPSQYRVLVLVLVPRSQKWGLFLEGGLALFLEVLPLLPTDPVWSLASKAPGMPDSAVPRPE